jgi:signal transduction histidine kinase
VPGGLWTETATLGYITTDREVTARGRLGTAIIFIATIVLLAVSLYTEDVATHRILMIAAILVLAVGLLPATMRGRPAPPISAERGTADPAAPSTLDRLVTGSPALLYLGRVAADGSYERLYATRNAFNVTGWTDDEMNDPDRVWSHVWAQDSALRFTNFQRAVRLGRSTAEFRFHRPDDSVIWLRNEVVCIARFDDGSAEVAGAVTNITRERELAAMAEFHSRMATLGELATGLAHELTQPVTVIGMAAELARDIAREAIANPTPDARQQERLLRQIDHVLSQVGRATEIISHLRLYGHADGGALGPVDLRRAVEGAMTLASAPLRRAGVDVHLVLPDVVPAVRARSVQVEQVLINLFLNARDAMMGRSIEARHITVSVSYDEANLATQVLLHVADTGTGVASSAMPRLFDAFFTTKAPGDGTGLGLSISRALMEGFGGDIAATTSPGGATFTLRFQQA